MIEKEVDFFSLWGAIYLISGHLRLSIDHRFATRFCGVAGRVQLLRSRSGTGGGDATRRSRW